VVACGGSSDDSKTTTPSASATPSPNEDALAKSLLLTATDFPAGWSEEPDSSGGSPLDKCNKDSTGQQGKADSGSFSNGGSSSSSETVVVFDTAENIKASLQQLVDMSSCVTNSFNNGELDNSTTTYSGASFDPLTFPSFGDQSKAYRFRFHVRVTDETGSVEADGYIDVVYVIVGRIGFSVSGFDTEAPFDGAQLQGIVQAAEAKVKACTTC
jgi:hypothetical protein